MAESIIPANRVNKIPNTDITMLNGSLMANDSYTDRGLVGISAEFAQVVPTSTGVWFSIAKLSEKYWPSEIIYALGFSTNGNYMNIKPFVVAVQMDGTIQAMNSETSNRYYFINISYHE